MTAPVTVAPAVGAQVPAATAIVDGNQTANGRGSGGQPSTGQGASREGGANAGGNGAANAALLAANASTTTPAAASAAPTTATAQPVQATTASGTPAQALAPMPSAQAPTQVVAAPPVAPSVPVPPPPLTAQLTPRLVALPELGNGVHRLTMDVKPESIGSVRVVADIRPDSMTISLIGGSDAAKDALKSVLADLRRDLAASVPNASLDLGEKGQRPQGYLNQGSQTGGDQAGSGNRGSAASGSRLGAGAGEDDMAGDRVMPLKRTDGRVDVLA